MRKKVQIINSSRDGVPEIKLYGDIGQYDAENIAYSLTSYDGERVRICINSFGGYVKDAFTILAAMNAYMATGGIIETVNEGRADSCAGWIFSAGTRGQRKILQFAGMFFHAPLFEDGAKITDLPEGDENRTMLEDYFDKLINIFVSATGKAYKAIKSIMEVETELNADEAVKQGFADTKLMVDNVPRVKNSVSRKEFCNIVNSLEYVITPETGHKSIQNMKRIATLLNLNPEASEEAIRAQIEAITNKATEAKAETQRLMQALAIETAAKESAETALAELQSSEVVNYVDTLIKEDATKENQREFLVNMGKSNFEAFKATFPVAQVVNGVDLNKGIDPSGSDKKTFAQMSLTEREQLKVTNRAEYLTLLAAYEKGE